MYSPKRIVQIIKSLVAREIFKRILEVKKILWGGEFWSKGYYISTVGKHSNENVISRYVKEPGRNDYKLLHKDMSKLGQLSFFRYFAACCEEFSFKNTFIIIIIIIDFI